MKKWLAILAAGLLTLLAAVYVTLFTGFGNRLVSPLIKTEIEKNIGMAVQGMTFALRPGRFALNLALDEKNRLEAEGRYGIFSGSVDARYRLRLDDLARLASLLKRNLHGQLHTDGTIRGDRNDLVVEGTSDLAQSDTTYRLSLKNQRPTDLQAEIKNASLAALLIMSGQKPYAEARLDLRADLTDLDPAALTGEVSLRLHDGEFDRRAMNADFGIDLPETRFTAKTTAQMKASRVKVSTNLTSNLANIDMEGDLVSEPLAADLVYDIAIEELALFQPVTGAPLRGPFSSRGTVRGDRKKMTVTGRSDLAGSDTYYNLDLKEFKPARLIAKVQGADLSKLLHLSGQPNLAAGNLDVDLQLDSLDPENLSGSADVRIQEGTVNAATMKRVYGIDLPPTTFSVQGGALLADDEVRYEAGLTSNLASVNSKGTVVPRSLGMDLDYRVDAKRLEVFKPLTGITLRGPLAVSGSARGDKKKLQISACTDLADGESCLNAELQEFAPAAVKADIRHLRLKGLLAMLDLPPYADALLNADVDIDDARPDSLRGKITTKLTQGKANRETLAREFDLKPPETAFETETASTLQGDHIDTTAKLTTTLASVNIDKARYQLRKNRLTGDYRADIPDLAKLQFIAGRPLKGTLRITGTVEKEKDVKVTAHSDTLGGAVDATLLNDDLHADLTGLQTMDLLAMLVYPQVFRSGLKGTLAYNLKSRKGRLETSLSQGKFVPTLMTSLTAQLARFDLTREVFQGSLISDIDKEIILSDLDLRAENASVVGQGARLNAQTRQIDARLKVVANNNPIDVVIRGDVNRPKVNVDVKNLLQREAERYIERQVGDQFKGLLKNLFK